jgi:hypothetical protein
MYINTLSPPAQRIVNAAAKELLKQPGSVNLSAISAAVLRALVEECAHKRQIHPDSLGTEEIIDADDAISIASELELQ